MKKLLIILLGILLFPVIAKADMGAPEMLSYNVEVTKASGTILYHIDYNGGGDKLIKITDIPKDSQLLVYYEETINGETYGHVNYKDESGYIKLSDTTILTKAISLDDENVTKLDKSITYTVLVDSLEVHSNPAKGFEVVGTLKKGTTIEVKYKLYDSWCYIEYKDIKGWVEGYFATLGEYKNEKILVATEHELIDVNEILNYMSKDNVLATIPANTVIDGYYALDPWARGYYIEYNGQKGYIDLSNVGKEFTKKIKLFNDIKAFEDINDTYDYIYEGTTKNSITIKKDTILSATYYYHYPYGTGNGKYYQVEYNNKEYWISDTFFFKSDLEEETFFDRSFIAIITDEEIVAKEKFKVYETPYYYSDEESNSIATISKNEKIKVEYCIDGWLYIEKSDGTKGWIEYYEYYWNLISGEEPLTNFSEEDEEIEIKEKSLGKEEFLYICIGGAVVVSLTALVIIIIISKKRKNKTIDISKTKDV
ncbi:MAG: SH3 domain-containing protein [Candidatus Coprovivens sp.]